MPDTIAWGSDEVAERRFATAKCLQTLHVQGNDLRQRLTATAEQWATVHEERLGISAEYRLLARDARHAGWARQALEDERALLYTESALGREWLRLLGEQRRLQQELDGLLKEQAVLLHFARAAEHFQPW